MCPPALRLIKSPRSVRLLMIYSGKAEKLAALSAGWQQLVNTSSGTVQLPLQEGEAVSADQAHVELETEDGPAAARRAVFIVTHHLKSKMKHLFSVRGRALASLPL